MDKPIGNCYVGCAYMCHRILPYKINKKFRWELDARFPDRVCPASEYYCYCPKHPKDGFDMMQEVDDYYSLFGPMFKRNTFKDYLPPLLGIPYSPRYSCFCPRENVNSFTHIQDLVNEYSRL